MPSRSAWPAALLALLVATSLFAQNTTEYSRTSGGEIEVIPKAARRLSGSLSLSSGSLFGSRNGSLGYEASLGGSILKDRVWFFASALQQESRFVSSQVTPIDSTITVFDAKATAQLSDRQFVIGSYGTGNQAINVNPAAAEPFATLPAQFLSLRYTATISSNMFFDMSVSSRSLSR